MVNAPVYYIIWSMATVHYMVNGPWCLVPGAWCLVPGAWCLYIICKFYTYAQ